MNNCPKCEKPAVQSCRCPRRDSECENGHQWHTCTVHKVIVEGGSDHSKDTFSCTCAGQKVYSEQLNLPNV